MSLPGRLARWRHARLRLGAGVSATVGAGGTMPEGVIVGAVVGAVVALVVGVLLGAFVQALVGVLIGLAVGAVTGVSVYAAVTDSP